MKNTENHKINSVLVSPITRFVGVAGNSLSHSINYISVIYTVKLKTIHRIVH